MTIRIKVRGEEFPLTGLLTQPKINDLVAMKLHLDISLPELERRMNRIDQLDGGWTSLELYEHPDLLAAIAAVAWLARRNAGRRIPIEEALDLGPQDVELVGDPEDEESDEEADPTTPASSAEDADQPQPKVSTGRKTKTSAPTS